MEMYLVSGDYIDFENPIKVTKFEKVILLGKKCLLVELEKAIDYSDFGVKRCVSQFILLDRFFNNRLHQLTDFPIEVHVFVPNDLLNPLKGFNKWDDLFSAAWASLYNSYSTALANEG